MSGLDLPPFLDAVTRRRLTWHLPTVRSPGAPSHYNDRAPGTRYVLRRTYPLRQRWRTTRVACYLLPALWWILIAGWPRYLYCWVLDCLA